MITIILKENRSYLYDPTVATKELVDEVYGIVNDRGKGIRIIATAKSAVRHNLENQLHNITAPTCLIWGNNDTITPPFVAEKFNELIKNSELHFDKCGHSPMMEIPENSMLSLLIFEKSGRSLELSFIVGYWDYDIGTMI